MFNETQLGLCEIPLFLFFVVMTVKRSPGITVTGTTSVFC